MQFIVSGVRRLQISPTHTNNGDGKVHCWSGRFWDVPESWMFPKKTTRRNGWRLWVSGLPTQRIKPFSQFQTTMLPKNVRNIFKTEWRPIFSRMEQGIDISLLTESMHDDIVNSTYLEGTAYIKTNICSYIWSNSNFKSHDEWSVATWSKRTNYTDIEKFGTDSDKKLAKCN
jgi:hypothetical protein